MPFTGIVFFQNVDNATLDNIAALNDTKYFTSGDDIIVPADYSKVIGLYGLGDTTTRMRITSPSLLKRAPFEIRPIDTATEPVDRPPFHNLVKNPLQLDSDEALNAESINTGAAAVDQYCAVWLANENITPLEGQDIFSVRATGTLTATADAWSNGLMTLGSDLAVGTYAMVGARVEGATAILCRFIFPDDITRPMCIANDLESDIDESIFRYGNLGIWGTFKHDRPPRFEILCAAADTAQTFNLDLVRVS